MTEPLLPNAHCARCGGDFRCGVNDATACACSTLVLPAALLAQLRRQFQGCLCLDCLRALSGQAQATAQAPH